MTTGIEMKATGEQTLLNAEGERFTLRHVHITETAFSNTGAVIRLHVGGSPLQAVTEAELVRERFFPDYRLVLDDDGLRFEQGFFDRWSW